MRKVASLVVSLALAVALGSLGAAGCRKASESTARPAAEGSAPDFTLTSLDGVEITLSSFAGKVVVLDFWATWCPPCRELIPNMVALHRKYSGQGLVVLGIALDREGEKVVGPFAREAKIPYPIVIGTPGVAEAYGKVESIPTIFIIDRNGKLVRKLVGFHSLEELESQVTRYL